MLAYNTYYNMSPISVQIMLNYQKVTDISFLANMIYRPTTTSIGWHYCWWAQINHGCVRKERANCSEGERTATNDRESLWASLRTLPSCQRSTNEMLVFDYDARYTAFIYSTADQQLVTHTIDQNSSGWQVARRCRFFHVKRVASSVAFTVQLYSL